MTPNDLEGAGRLLFGEGWKRPLADLVGVNERSVNRWARGESPIPDGVAAEVVAAIVEKMANNIEAVLRAQKMPSKIAIAIYKSDCDIAAVTGDGWRAAFHRELMLSVSKNLARRGIEAELRSIDPDAFFNWLKQNGKKNSPATRAAFAADNIG